MKEKFQSVKKWISDYGYAYKGIAIGVACVVLLVVYLTVHYATLVSPDYLVVVALKDESMINAQQVALQQQLEKYGEDLNNDGKVVVEILYSALYTNTSNANAYSSEHTRLSAEINSNTWCMVVYDKDSYDHMVNQMNLFDEGSYKNDDGTFSSWNWRGSKFEEEVNSISAIAAELYFDARIPRSDDRLKDSQIIQKRIEDGKALLERIKGLK